MKKRIRTAAQTAASRANAAKARAAKLKKKKRGKFEVIPLSAVPSPPSVAPVKRQKKIAQVITPLPVDALAELIVAVWENVQRRAAR